MQEEVVPVLHVENVARAVAWYRRLGFVKEWEHQFEPGFPWFEHLFELVFHASVTGFVISDPDTGFVHEANEAFCRFLGRSRAEVIGRTREEIGAMYATQDRDQLLEQVRLHGIAREMPVRARQPDGTVRAGVATSQLVQLGGSPQLVSTVLESPDDTGA